MTAARRSSRRVWLVLPLGLLAVLTAASSDFAPERHLSFLLPGYAAALAGFAHEVRRRAGTRYGAWVAAAVVAALLAPGWTADHNELANFNANLRDASLYMAGRFGDTDVLATTAGTLSQAEDPRLVGAYAVLAAPDSAPLSSWQHVGSLRGCKLVRRLDQRHAVDRLWLMLSVQEPGRVGTALRAAGADVHGFGTFLVVSDMPGSADRALGPPEGQLPLPHGGAGRPGRLRRAPDGAAVPPRRQPGGRRRLRA